MAFPAGDVSVTLTTPVVVALLLPCCITGMATGAPSLNRLNIPLSDDCGAVDADADSLRTFLVAFGAVRIISVSLFKMVFIYLPLLIAPVFGLSGLPIFVIGLLSPNFLSSKYGLNGSNASGVFLPAYGISIFDFFD